MSQPSKQPNSALDPTLQQPNLSQDETPTMRIPRVKMPAPQLSTEKKADPGAADPSAVKAEKASRQRELGENKPEGAQDYRKRVEEAQLPDNVRKAALREVGKLERTSDQSPEFGYIRSWLDTVLGLLWSTKTTDSIDIQPAQEVDPATANTEKAAEKVADPARADTEKGPGKYLDPADTGARKVAQAKVEPPATGTEKANTAPAGPKDDDTVEIPTVRAVPSGGRPPQKLSKQQAKLQSAATSPQKTVQTEAEPTATDPHKMASKQIEPAIKQVEPAATPRHKTAQTKADPVAADTEKLTGKNHDPAAAVTQKAAQTKAEPAAVRAEKVDTALAGPEDDDTVEIPAVRAVPSGGRPPEMLSNQQGKLERPATDPHQTAQAKAASAPSDPHRTASKQVDPAVTDPQKGDIAPAALNGDGLHPSPQLPEQQVFGLVPVDNPPEKKRFRWLALAATLLAALLIGALLFGANRGGGVTAQSSVPTPSASAPTVSSPTSEPSDESPATGGGEPTIQLEDLAGSARAFEPVPIQGVYRGGADTFVRVQRREEGRWVFFPLPTRTDPSGRFTAYVELAKGRHRLRVVDPRSGVTSEPFVLVVKG
ncbi:MAG TPA: hypothetical protein VE462_10780 [Propionibacteriaceae bacterium]|nr:hypothetical protein [Propionibacteriaceae bacterium]